MPQSIHLWSRAPPSPLLRLPAAGQHGQHRHRLRDGERIFELDTEIAQGAKNTPFRKAMT